MFKRTDPRNVQCVYIDSMITTDRYHITIEVVYMNNESLYDTLEFDAGVGKACENYLNWMRDYIVENYPHILIHDLRSIHH